MATVEDKIRQLKDELDKLLAEERYKNVVFIAGGSMTSGGRNFLR